MRYGVVLSNLFLLFCLNSCDGNQGPQEQDEALEKAKKCKIVLDLEKDRNAIYDSIVSLDQDEFLAMAEKIENICTEVIKLDGDLECEIDGEEGIKASNSIKFCRDFGTLKPKWLKRMEENLRITLMSKEDCEVIVSAYDKRPKTDQKARQALCDELKKHTNGNFRCEIEYLLSYRGRVESKINYIYKDELWKKYCEEK